MLSRATFSSLTFAADDETHGNSGPDTRRWGPAHGPEGATVRRTDGDDAPPRQARLLACGAVIGGVLLAGSLVVSLGGLNPVQVPKMPVIPRPSGLPTNLPTNLPTDLPTGLPTTMPTGLPTLPPGLPTDIPTPPSFPGGAP